MFDSIEVKVKGNMSKKIIKPRECKLFGRIIV